jgi:hypothetical protein
MEWMIMGTALLVRQAGQNNNSAEVEEDGQNAYSMTASTIAGTLHQ